MRRAALCSSLVRALRRGPQQPTPPAPRWRSTKAEPPAPGTGPQVQPTPAELEAARSLAEAKLKLESGGLFPWEASAFGDRTKPLAWWQKAYWVVFGCVTVAWLGEKSFNKVTTGKWHGDGLPLPQHAKSKPKRTLIKSRARLSQPLCALVAHCLF